MSQRLIACSIIMLFLLSSAPVLGETYYKWKDKDGVVHITNTPQNVPEGGRGVQEQELGPDSRTGPQRNIESPTAPPPRQQPAPADTPSSLLQKEQEAREQQLSAQERERREVEQELNSAEACILDIAKQEYEYLRPDTLRRCLTEEEINQLPRNGYDLGAPRIDSDDARYFLKQKVERLKQRLRQLQ